MCIYIERERKRECLELAVLPPEQARRHVLEEVARAEGELREGPWPALLV